jgi:peptidoglycan/LPS O-acetylase OafA/YrhL
MIEMPLSKLLHIQFLRGLAALAVAFLHAQHDAAALAIRTGDAFEAFTRFPFMAGVDVFFVISGFIMVYASRPLFGKPESRGVFLARRIARIAPLYWAVTTLYLAIAVTAPFVLNQPQPSAWLVIASYLFVPAMRADGLVQPVYSLGWTLNYEMFFYVLFAAVIALPLKTAMVRLMAILIGLVLVGSIMRLPRPLAFWTDPIILEFALGAGLGWLQSQGVTLGRTLRWTLAIMALALLGIGGADVGGTTAIMRPIMWGIPAALLVAAATLRQERTETVSSFTRFCAFLGDISYAIYLIHPFVIRGISETAIKSGLVAVIGPYGFVLVAMAGTVVAAWVVHRTLERPATAYMRRRLEKAAAA